MNRRTFLSSLPKISGGIIVLKQTVPNIFGWTNEPILALPTADQLAWQELEIGMFIHFAPNTWQDNENDNRSTPLSQINPQIDTDQWAECAAVLGAKYIVFVAKHVGGFCMWQTATTDYSIKNTPWRNGRGDVIADLAASCQKRGLKLGVYLSPRDDNFGAELGGRCKDSGRQVAYNTLYRRQLTEVLSRYGEMVEIWFDGSLVVPVKDILKEHAPHSMIFQGEAATIRWIGNEDGVAPYPCWNSISQTAAATGTATASHSDPNGSVWMPNEVDVSIRRPSWFWSTQNEQNLLSLEALLEIYYQSVGRGAQLLLNLPPNRDGVIPQADFARARGFGQEIERRFGRRIAETQGTGKEVTMQFSSAQRVDHVILQEDCSAGERVRSYRIEGHSNKKWTALADGISIGHKRIQRLPSTIVDSLRFIATASVGLPRLRRFAAFEAAQ
jgi:alpha-L-fucosidase